MNCFITLPRELALLVLSYTSDEVDEKLLCVNHKFLTFINNCLSQDRLWKLRYSNAFHHEECCYPNVLPETSAHYGWPKLYHKVKEFDIKKEVTLGKSYVGPTGNIFFCWDKVNYKYMKVHTCPILELLSIEETFVADHGTVLLIVYISFDLSLRSHMMSNFKNEAEISWTSTRTSFTGPCERYFAKDNMLIFLQHDGSVVHCEDKSRLRKIVDITFRNQPSSLCGMRVISPINCFRLINSNCTLWVDTFRVSCTIGGVTEFTWPRTSPAYFECLRKEMERLSTK